MAGASASSTILGIIIAAAIVFAIGIFAFGGLNPIGGSKAVNVTVAKPTSMGAQ